MGHAAGLGRRGRHSAVRSGVLCPAAGTVKTVQLDAVTAPLEAGSGPHGLGADEQGFVYSVNLGSNNVSKVDAATCEVVKTYKVGGSPYTYSDLTGFIYRNVTRKPVGGP